MSEHNTTLKIISNETKNSIDQMSIVTPSVYASIFSEYATKHDTILEDENSFAEDIIKKECTTLTSLQEDTSKSANQLSEHANRAIAAIKAKDESALNKVLHETQSLKSEIEKLKEAVYKDELTRLYNRKWLRDTYLTDETDNFNTDGILVLIDLNFFKQVNDTHGHIIGDKVLAYIAVQLKQTKSHVIRYGGDEFIVIFKANTSIKYAHNSLHEIRESVISKKLKAQEHKFTVSFSYGAIAFKQGDDLGDSIQAADAKMYDDKIQIKKRITGI